MGNRTHVDFSKHIHTVEIYKCGDKEIRVDSFQKPDTYLESIRFINGCGIMTVTGDWGNWVFCRRFIPNKEDTVVDDYWLAKLIISSSQKPQSFDEEATKKRIEELIKHDLEHIWGLSTEVDEEDRDEGSDLDRAKGWFNELLNEIDDELSYTAKAYRDFYRPSSIDHEDIPFELKTNYWLLAIFDAFDEICSRLRESKS